MLTQRQLFLQHVAQTSDAPLALEIEKAEGVYLYDTLGKAYIDLIAGISVSNLGHRHPKVVEAIKKQLDQYMHLMVYGEYIQSPQVQLAQLLAQQLPPQLDSTYFVNSGTEATEGAMKLAKRYTGRPHLLSFQNAYHGSTHGALSIMGGETFKQAFRPLLPGTQQLKFNSVQDLDLIDKNTAGVVIEVVQGEAGVILPQDQFLLKVRERCNAVGALMIVDEVQTGFGRTGSLFAFEQYGIQPDILTLAKGMGGGMPLGAFIASKQIMSCLTHDPVLGHITTFGGHPVSCAASLATLKVLLEEPFIFQVKEKAALFVELLQHPAIQEVRHKGLLMAVQLDSFEMNLKVIQSCVQKGLITDWFLFADDCLRIAPPLIISPEEIRKACTIIIECIDQHA